MPRPEGYRKARRLFDLANRFRLPIIIFIDTPGAYPGIGAEERGQAEAIATNLEVMSSLHVPSISIVIGEGASGGALGLGVTSRILMLQYAWYNVISPESCSSILYRDPGQGKKSAEALKLTAKDLSGFGIADEIIPEPAGGAHRDPDLVAKTVGDAIRRHLAELEKLTPEQLVVDRYKKYRVMGVFTAEE
jgi:acetyl-CoA carboxylase carboxyl transferase subunit alpha